MMLIRRRLSFFINESFKFTSRNNWLASVYVSSRSFKITDNFYFNRYNTTVFNQEIINSFNLENSVMDKYFEKLDTKMKHFENISKLEFQKFLTAVEKEGCNENQGLLLLKCCSEFLSMASFSERNQLFFSTWKLLKDTRKITLDHYHAILSYLIDNEHFTICIEDILLELKTYDLEPDENMYLQLFRYACSSGDINQMTNLLIIFKEEGISLNETSCNYIILGHGRASNFEESEKVLNFMIKSNIPPSSETYTMLLKSAAEVGNYEKFMYYFNKYSSNISDSESLDIIESLPIGNLDKLIPKVLDHGEWALDKNLTFKLIKTCRRLIYKGHIDSSLTIIKNLNNYISSLSTNGDNESSYALFYIHEIVKSNVPPEKIIEICDNLKPYNSYALLKATQVALFNNMETLSIQLFQKLSERGYPLRPHYFWPIFTYAGKRNGESGVLTVLDHMLNLGVQPDHETLAKWMYTHCNLSKPIELVRKLNDKGLEMNLVITTVVQSLLIYGRLVEAASVCKKFKTKLTWDKENILKIFSNQFISTQDIDFFITLLNSVKNKDLCEDIINLVLSKKNSNTDDSNLQLIKRLKESGFTVPSDILFSLGSGLKSNRVGNLNGISGNTNFTHPSKMNLSELENHLIELKRKKMNTRGVLRRLLQLNCRLGNNNRVLEIKKELEDSGFKFSPGMQSSLLETFVQCENINEAEKCLLHLKTHHTGFNLDTYKIVDLAALYVKCGRFENAVEFLSKQNNIKADNSFSRNCWRLLNIIAEKYGPDETEKMLMLLIDKNYCIISNSILGPVLKSYLFRKDYLTAVNVYEKYAKDYNCTPLQHELLCSLLTEEAIEDSKLSKQTNRDKNNIYSELLKKVIRIGTSVHGKDSTNIAVLVALAECNLLEKIKKLIMETYDGINEGLLLKRSCRLADENKPDVLKRIIDHIKHLPYIDIQQFYNVLLDIYVRKNDCDSGLSLWINLQEDNVVINELFLTNLENLLISNKLKVPFSSQNV